MKKLKLFVVTAATIVFASCGKDETPKPTQPQHSSVQEQVMNLIKKADIKLYNSIINAAGTKTKSDIQTSYVPGYFYIPNNPRDPAHSGLDNATCLGTNGACIVTVSASAKTLDPGPDATMITSDMETTYAPGTTKLILNDDNEKPTTLDITWLKVSFKDGGASVNFK